MNRSILRTVGTIIFVLGLSEALDLIDFPISNNYIGWVVTAFGLVLIIASNFLTKQKPDQ